MSTRDATVPADLAAFDLEGYSLEREERGDSEHVMVYSRPKA